MTRQLPNIRSMLGELIATPSISSVNPSYDQGNRPLIELLAGWCEDIGCEIDIMAIPGQPDKANLIAKLGSGEGGLVLSGHADTVPYDENKWRFDPFQLHADEGRWYGLGSCDMKGFFPAAIEAMRRYRDTNLTAPVFLVATADEESSMSGAQLLVDTLKPQARYAVIGEPTELRPIRMHKGILMESVILTGHSGHSSDPSLGASALEGMHLLIGELLRWRAELQTKHHNDAFEVPIPTLNLGHIHGGDNPNRICAHCQLDFDLRPLPGMDPEFLRTHLQSRLRAAIKDPRLSMEFKRLFQGIPPMQTPAASPIVQACEELTGHTAGAVNFGTEGPYLNRLGMDTVICGPGSIDQAHQPDEFITESSMVPATELYSQLIRRFCTA